MASDGRRSIASSSSSRRTAALRRRTAPKVEVCAARAHRPAGPDGALWFTNFVGNSIGRISTSGVVSNYTDPSISEPTGITAGPDGALWFTNFGGGNDPGSIGRIAINPASAPDNDLALSNLPGKLTVNATSPAGATVSYTPPTVVDEDSPLPLVDCLPASGSLFPIGLTTVSCTATATGDVNSPVTATFTVTVNGATAQLRALLASVTGVGPGNSLSDKVTHIQGDVAANDTSDACDALGGLSNEVRAQTGKKITAAKAASLIGQVQAIKTALGC